jgi:hypothetical protein
LYAAPKFLFSRDQDAEIQRVHGDRDLDPLATAHNDRQHRLAGMRDPHIVLHLGHVLFSCSLLRE